jgi:Domain of unknown function (DUF397)
MDGLNWRKSTYSGNGEACIELGHTPGAVLIRDTTDRGGITLSVRAAPWKAFLATLR